MRFVAPLILSTLLVGCAKGQLDVLDQNDKVIGSCSANFDFHWYGAQDSVNYILYLCAKSHIEKGRKISDESILTLDYTLPVSPQGHKWNKALAKQAYSDGQISEQQLGYLLAHVEYQYWMRLSELKKRLDEDDINQIQYDKQAKLAKMQFEGQEE